MSSSRLFRSGKLTSALYVWGHACTASKILFGLRKSSEIRSTIANGIRIFIFQAHYLPVPQCGKIPPWFRYDFRFKFGRLYFPSPTFSRLRCFDFIFDPSSRFATITVCRNLPSSICTCIPSTVCSTVPARWRSLLRVRRSCKCPRWH